MNPKLSIVIPVWNNWLFTKNCLEDLSHLDYVEIIVVDNGSDDETKNLNTHNNITVVKNNDNKGFALASNQGYSIARSNNVMFLNNDIKVIKKKNKWIDPIIDACSKGALVGPTVGILRSDLSFVKESDKLPRSGYGYMSGWNITAQKTIWEKLILDGEIGPFSSEFGKAYFEDTDLGLRARELEIPLEIVNVPVKHFGKMTSKNLGTGELYLSARQKFLAKWQGKV